MEREPWAGIDENNRLSSITVSPHCSFSLFSFCLSLFLLLSCSLFLCISLCLSVSFSVSLALFLLSSIQLTACKLFALWIRNLRSVMARSHWLVESRYHCVPFSSLSMALLQESCCSGNESFTRWNHDKLLNVFYFTIGKKSSNFEPAIVIGLLKASAMFSHVRRIVLQLRCEPLIGIFVGRLSRWL